MPVADESLMARALRLAGKGLYTTDPNPRVGCVLVKGGRVIAEGWHRRAGEAHAEIVALRAAAGEARGADCYVTLEPCSHHGRTPPCADALIDAGVRRVVAAMADPNPLVAGRGLARLRAAGVETRCGVLAGEAERLNRGFCLRMREGRPWITVKMAASMDGRTAMASGESRWITSPESRRDVHRLRARSSAMLTGIGTVLADDPALTARLEEDEEVLQPVRVVLDSGLRMPPDARMLSQPGRTVVVTLSPDRRRRLRLEKAGAEVWRVDGREGRIDLTALMSRLADEEVNEVLVEAGPVLNGALAELGLVNEWVLYLAPCVLGDTARGLFHLPALETMAQRLRLCYREVRRVGPDLKIRLEAGE